MFRKWAISKSEKNSDKIHIWDFSYTNLCVYLLPVMEGRHDLGFHILVVFRAVNYTCDRDFLFSACDMVVFCGMIFNL